jgi:DNA-binding transcriptional LysR family regulator
VPEMDRLAAMATFVRVIEAGSFSSAAKQLRVGQPAVSKTIAQLEHGIAELRGRTLAERARALVAVSDPAFRAELEEASEQLV